MADNNYEDLFNSDVVDVNGNKIGSIGRVYLDDQTGQPSWITVKTGWFGLKETFVPLEQAVIAEGTITVPYDEEKVKYAPRVDPDKHLDADEEAQLYAYYGIATVLSSDEAVVAGSDDVVAEDVVSEDVVAEDFAAESDGVVAESEDVAAETEPVVVDADAQSVVTVVEDEIAADALTEDDAVSEPAVVDDVVADPVLVADETVVADEAVVADTAAVDAPELAVDAQNETVVVADENVDGPAPAGEPRPLGEGDPEAEEAIEEAHVSRSFAETRETAAELYDDVYKDDEHKN